MRSAALALTALLAAATLGLGASAASEDEPATAVWEQLPTGDQIIEAILSFPPCGPDGTYTDGSAMVECRLAADGRLEQCKVVREAPEGCSFGKVALVAAQYFKAGGTRPDGRPLTAGTRMFVPMAFKAPPEDRRPPVTTTAAP
jgi:hypothetical protein